MSNRTSVPQRTISRFMATAFPTCVIGDSSRQHSISESCPWSDDTRSYASIFVVGELSTSLQSKVYFASARAMQSRQPLERLRIGVERTLHTRQRSPRIEAVALPT